MIFESQIMAEVKQKDFDRFIIRQHQRLTNFAERLADEKDAKKRERGEAVLNAQFEELSSFKDWADTAMLLINHLIENEQKEKNEAYSKGYNAGQKSKDMAGYVGGAKTFREFKENLRTEQIHKWADHINH